MRKSTDSGSLSSPLPKNVIRQRSISALSETPYTSPRSQHHAHVRSVLSSRPRCLSSVAELLDLLDALGLERRTPMG
jgi:hypothetical protein